jgi:hypothetical protein
MAKKLSNEVIERLNGRVDIKKDLCKKIRCDYSTLFLWLRKNEQDGPLTRLAVGDLLKGYFGIDYDRIYTDVITNNNKGHERVANL